MPKNPKTEASKTGRLTGKPPKRTKADKLKSNTKKGAEKLQLPGDPEPIPSNPPPPGFPTLPTGEAGVYGLDAAGNLVIYPFPASERYFKAGPEGVGPTWTNT